MLKLEKEKIVIIAPGFFNQFDPTENIQVVKKDGFLKALDRFLPGDILTKHLITILKQHFKPEHNRFIDLEEIRKKLQTIPLEEERTEETPQKIPNQKQFSEENSKIVKTELKKICCCGKEIVYNPRNLKNIPKRPKTQCSGCKKWIYYKRQEVIDFASEMIKFDLTNSDQLLTKVDQNQFGKEELLRKSPNTNIGTDRNRVEGSYSHDQLQKNDQFMTKTDQFTTEQEKLVRKSPNSRFVFVEKFSIHKVRYQQDLISKPNWLFGINTSGKYDSLTIKRVPMRNWDKFILYTKDYDTFSGIHNIEVCNNVIIYNFRHKREDCIVKSGEEIDQFFKKIQNHCQKAREYLIGIGFEINSADPEECQKPHFVFEGDEQGNAELEALNHISKYCEIKSKTSNNENMWDESKGPETETDDKAGVQATLDLNKNIEKIQKDISDLNNAMTQMTQSQSQLYQFQSQLAQAQTTMANAITNLTNLMTNQMTNFKNQSPGGMHN